MRYRGVAVCLLVGGVIWMARPAGADDVCGKQGADLRARETQACSGVAYVFNPSACYRVQRELKEFATGPCRKAGPPTAQIPIAVSDTKPAPVQSSTSVAHIPVPPRQSSTADQQSEIERLKAEIVELKQQMEVLKARCRQE